MNPEFVLFTGPMFGGKTTKMLASLERAKHQKKTIVLFKPKRDNRYFFEKVSSHNGISWDAQNIVEGENIFAFAKNADIVAVDEAFMIPNCAEALINLFKAGKSIYVSSLQLSSKNKPFDEIVKLFPYTTRVEVCPAVCPICGQDAFYTISKNKTSNIKVGGAEIYEPRCFTHTFCND